MLRYLLIFCCFIGLAKSINAQRYSDSISVNFFLIDECRICQNMTGEINEVMGIHNSDNIVYNAYFPNSSSTEKNITDFMSEYNLSIPFHTDCDKVKTKHYNASIAPQVVVYDERNQVTLYSGRIDNSYAQIGSRRRVVTSKDLRATLSAIQNNKPIPTAETEAVGCYINK